MENLRRREREGRFERRFAERKFCFFDLGGGGNTTVVQAPDTSQLQAQSAESIAASKEMAANQLASNEKINAENLAAVQPLVDIETENAKQAQQNAQDYNDYTKSVFRPQIDQLNQEANDFSTAGAKENFASQAEGTLAGQQAAERQQSERAMEAVGVNPNSGRFASLNRGTEILNAGALAGAKNDARVQAQQLADAKRYGVIGAVTGMPSLASGALSVSNQGASGAGSLAMAPGQLYMNGLNQAAGTQQAGYNAGIGGLSSVGQIQNQAYGYGLKYQAANEAAQGQMLGTIGGLAGMAMFM